MIPVGVEHLRIHQPGRQVVLGQRLARFLLGLGAHGVHVSRRNAVPWPVGRGRRVLQHLAAQGLGEAVGREAQLAPEQRHDALGESHLACRIGHVLGRQVVGHHHDGHVPHHLGRGRDLHDIAEQPVDLGIGLRDLRPAMLQTDGTRLLAQVRVLPARHLVVVDIGRATADLGLERRVEAPHALEVVGQLAQRLRVKLRIARITGQHGHDGVEAGLRGEPAHRVQRPVHGIHAGRHGRHHRGHRSPTGVMGMEMYGQPDFLAQHPHEFGRRTRTAHPRHVLDAQHMAAGLFQLAGQVHVIGQVVLGPRGVEDVGRVAERALADGAGLAHRIDGHPHVLDPVERIEHPEHIDALRSGLLHEVAHHVVGIVGVAHRVGCPQEHLQQHVGHGGAQLAQALPRVFLQEAEGHVKRGSPPALQRQQLRQPVGIDRRRRQHVVRAHAGGKQRLVRIAQRGVGDQQLGLLPHPAGKALGAQGLQALLVACRRRHIRIRLRRHAHLHMTQIRRRTSLHVGLTVDDDIAQILQQACGPVAPCGEVEELRRVVDEAGGDAPCPEVRVLDDVLDELQVGGQAADAELAQRPVHPADGLLLRGAPGRDLDQQRIVVRRDDRAAESGAAVQADPEAGRTAVGRHPAIVGREAVLGVFGGDAALQRVAIEADLFLSRHTRTQLQQPALGIDSVFTLADACAFRDADLRLHDVDARHFLGDGVLDLHARVDLDEVELAGIGVHQELDRAGVGVVDRTGQLQRRLAQPRTLLIGQIRCGRALHHLLVAPLHRAVALEQVHHIAMQVAQHLDLDVVRTAHQLLQVHLVIAEGRFRFAPRHRQLHTQVLRCLDGAHAAAAAAPAGLQHQRIANGSRQLQAFLDVVRQRVGGWHHRHAGCHGCLTRRHLVAQPGHHLGRGADEGNARRGAGTRQLGVLGQEAITRVNGIGTGLLGHPDDLSDVEVSLQRLLPLPHQVALVGLGPMQRKTVLVRIDADGAQPQLGGCTHHADGDLGAVGHQHRSDPPALAYVVVTHFVLSSCHPETLSPPRLARFQPEIMPWGPAPEPRAAVIPLRTGQGQ